jgi:hypothetical protein
MSGSDTVENWLLSVYLMQLNARTEFYSYTLKTAIATLVKMFSVSATVLSAHERK